MNLNLPDSGESVSGVGLVSEVEAGEVEERPLVENGRVIVLRTLILNLSLNQMTLHFRGIWAPILAQKFWL